MSNNKVFLLSHRVVDQKYEDSFLESKQSLINKVKNSDNIDYISIEKKLYLIENLSQFELGRFLIENKKFNGYYIHYVKMHPLRNCNPNLDQNGKIFNFLENFILNHSPTSLATQERFTISKNIIQKYLNNDCVFASIPCGLMSEFLELDLSPYHTFSFHGIDLDLETLKQAKEYSKRKNLQNNCEFYQADASNLNIEEKFDLITTDGFTIYESSNNNIVKLYRKFFKALRPNRVLLTSFLTPPPTPGNSTEWKMDEINQEHLFLEKIIVNDILNSSWINFRNTNLVIAQLKEAGFSILEIFYDKGHISPVILARKN